MRFEESWYANMGFMHAQDAWHRDHSESYPIPSSNETISLEPTNNITIKKIKLCLKIDFVCRNRTLGMQISKFRYAEMDFFQNTPYSNMILGKRLGIQIWIYGAFYLPLQNPVTTCKFADISWSVHRHFMVCSSVCIVHFRVILGLINFG